LVWSERQRGGVDFKVLDPVLCPEHGRQWGLGFTLVADRWGGVVVWVWLLAWRMGERGERDLEKILQDLGACMARVPSSSSFSFKFFEQGMAGVVLGAMLVID
jgi:hypothetical protein